MGGGGGGVRTNSKHPILFLLLYQYVTFTMNFEIFDSQKTSIGYKHEGFVIIWKLNQATVTNFVCSIKKLYTVCESWELATVAAT